MKNKLLLIFWILVFVLISTIIIIFYFVISKIDHLEFTQKWELTAIVMSLAFVGIVLLFLLYVFTKKKKENINKSFDYYIEKEISSAGVGIIIFDANSDIIWTSKFVENKLKILVGKKLFSISESFKNNYLNGKSDFKFEVTGIIFSAKVDLVNHIVILKDITKEEAMISEYTSEKLVIGELEIDNFQHLQSSLLEETIFKIRSIVVKTLDKLVEKNNFIYKQYVNGKYIFFTNQETLDTFTNENFSFLEEMRKEKLDDNVIVSVSIGIGCGTSKQRDLAELAKDGLLQAQARGGDQVSVIYSKEKPRYFGSQTEIGGFISRVKIKQIAQLLESRLKQSQITNVIIYGHKEADLDVVGSALGIAEMAQAYGKKVLIQNTTFDSTATRTMNKHLSKETLSLFVKVSKAIKETNDGTLVVIIDTAEMSRIENQNAFKKAKMENVFIFDHHRVFKLPQDIPSVNVYIDTNASSTCEIVSEIIQFTRRNIRLSKTASQMMLNGIYLDSQNFGRTTSARTYQAASFLERSGAESAISANILKIPAESSLLVNKIIANLEEVKKGCYLAVYEKDVPVDVVSIVADEILRTQGRKAAFVVAKIPGKQQFKVSARGIDTNVQRIMEAVGGGGHFSSAAAQSDESLPVFLDNLRQAIVSDKGGE